MHYFARKNILFKKLIFIMLFLSMLHAKTFVCYPSDNFSNFIKQFINPAKHDIATLLFRDNPNCEKSPMLPHLKKYLEQLKIDTNNRLKKGDMGALYDIQTYLQSTIIYAEKTHNKKIIKALIDLVIIPFNYLNENQEWIDKDYKNKEPTLAIAQYFTLLTRVLNAAKNNNIDIDLDNSKLQVIEKYLTKWNQKKFQIEANDISIKLKCFNENFKIFYKTVTKDGIKYIYLNDENISKEDFKPNMIHIGIGKQNCKNYIIIHPNIKNLINTYNKSNNSYLYTQEIQIRGKVAINNINAKVSIGGKTINFNYSDINKFLKNWMSYNVQNNNSMHIINNNGTQAILLDPNSSKDEYIFRFSYNRDFNNNLPKEITDTDILIFISTLQYLNYSKFTNRKFKINHNYIDNFLKNFSINFDVDDKYAYYNRYFKDFGSYKYCGYTTKTKKFDMFNANGKIIKAPKGCIVGWDISHSRRINWLIEALDNYKVKSKYFTNKLRDKYINTLADKVIFKDKKGHIHFTIYANGTNNWYRVGYSKKPFFGYNPSAYNMDIAFISGSYLLLNKYNKKILEAIHLWLNQNSNKNFKLGSMVDLEANMGILSILYR